MLIRSSILGAGTLDSDFLQPGDISELHTLHFDGLSGDGIYAVFALRPDRDPGATSDHQASCFDQSDSIERLTFERAHQLYTCLFLCLEIKIGERVIDYTTPQLAFEQPLGSLSLVWIRLFSSLLGKEKTAMASLSKRSMKGTTEYYSAMVNYHKNQSEYRWYRNSMQGTTKSPSNRPGITSSARWSGLSAASEAETNPRIALPSHVSCCPSSSHALQELSQYVQQSEALELSDTDDDLAPDPRSLTIPVTPTKPSSRENQTLANPPKKNQKLTRKFSEADLQDATPSKRPRLITRPSIAAQKPEIGEIEEAQFHYPLPTRLRHAHPDNEPKSSTTLQAEEHWRRRHYHRCNPQDSSENGMERIQITSSLASENERRYTYNSQEFIEAGMERMEIASPLASEDEDVYRYNSQDSSEAETDGMENTPSLGSEDEDTFADDELSSQ